ncbi:hypothetical protein ACFWOG_04490 [Kitasatospora sp. NPDC058406]|uniref:hypothetical protein n=1 Tax=Kitasatospora sp. NPDC058406 TaxID=3346483 RepID=UPI00365A1CC0
MTTTTLPQPTTNTTGNNDLNHVYCCSPNTALCGTDITDARDDDTADITCIVCADLIWDNTPCSPTCDIHTWA